MKKFTGLLLFIMPLIFAVSFLQAQSVLPLLEEGKTWNISEAVHFGQIITKTYALGNDTIIDDVSWTRLLISWDETPVNWGTSGLIREEDNGKVFYKPWENGGGFGEQRLIYDFGVEPGETFTSYGYFMNMEIEIEVIVTDIDTIMVEGQQRRRLQLASPTFYGQDHWIEGLGSEQGFLLPFSQFILIDIGMELLCVKKNDELLYMGPMETCYINTVGISENPIEQGISIYPNPASGSFTISIQEIPKEATFNIFDLCGKIVFTTEIKSRQQLIRHNLSPGTYIYRISSAGEPPTGGKLVIR